jgi:DNA repair exonuclease SbcCD ATPase subunit
MKLQKIFHVSDIHIRNVKRHKEYRLVFEKMFEEMRKRGTDDSIIYLAGDIAHAKLEMSPELVREISWLFTECSKLAPTICITGNHDCNMNNLDRIDVLTPIVEALNLPNFHYLRDTQVWSYGGVGFGVFSIFDNKNNWPKADDWALQPFDKKIALFHGPVDNSITDIGYVVSSRHFTTDMFDGYDLALLGDIHKRQEMISPAGCKIVYAGSLLQQNFGETLDKHGFLIWDLNTLTYEEIDIKNDYGYYTMDVISGVVPNANDLPAHPRLRVRFSDTDAADTKRAIKEIKRKYGVDDFTTIRVDSLVKKKTGDRNNRLEFEDISDINYQNCLLSDYIQRMMPFVTDEELVGLQLLNKDINAKIKIEDLTHYIRWKPIRFDFSNMFSYGENNVIKFDKLHGIMGLFAPNASGKSSLFDSISFCLFDKCSRAFKASHIMNNRKTQFSCQLEFQIDGISYFVAREARTVNKGKNVKVDVQFWRVVDGVAESLNGTERRDTNQIIEQYVGRYEDFVMTALSLQGNNALFIDKSQSERKDLLAQFMGLDIFDKLYECALEEIKEVSVLIKNFKKQDFTNELIEKENYLELNSTLLTQFQLELTNLNAEKEKIQNSISDLKESLLPIDSSLDIDKLLKTKEKIQLDIVDFTNTIFIKSENIKSYSELLDSLANTIKEKSYVNGVLIDIVKGEFDNLTNTISKLNLQIDKLKTQYEANLEKLKHLETHEYDPNCKFCLNNVFVKDAIKTKEVVVEQKIELAKLELELESLQSKLNSYLDIDILWKEVYDMKIKHQKGVDKKEKAEIELKALIAECNLLKNKLHSAELAIQKYNDNESAIKTNQRLNESILQLEVKKKSYDKTINDINKKTLEHSANIGSAKSFIDSIKLKIKEVKELESKNVLYTYYLDAVKKDGIPYELISKALPLIENEVNNILAQVVDFSVVMDVDGKNINAKIVYDDQEWALEMCSGMEKFISGLAIRVALINICNLPRPNFLVIDEGFGTLDSDNISSLFMMMQYLKTQFDFIWIISHLDQMRDVVDGIIEIKKVGGFSSINY